MPYHITIRSRMSPFIQSMTGQANDIKCRHHICIHLSMCENPSQALWSKSVASLLAQTWQTWDLADFSGGCFLRRCVWGSQDSVRWMEVSRSLPQPSAKGLLGFGHRSAWHANMPSVMGHWAPGYITSHRELSKVCLSPAAISTAEAWSVFLHHKITRNDHLYLIFYKLCKRINLESVIVFLFYFILFHFLALHYVPQYHVLKWWWENCCSFTGR